MVPQDVHDVLREMKDILEGMTRKNHREYYHDALEKREELSQLHGLSFNQQRETLLAGGGGERGGLLHHVKPSWGEGGSPGVGSSILLLAASAA